MSKSIEVKRDNLMIELEKIILNVLRKKGSPMQTKDIISQILIMQRRGIVKETWASSTIDRTIRRMGEKKIIRKVKRGTFSYKIPDSGETKSLLEYAER